MSSRFALAAGVLLASLAALPLSAQQSSGDKLRDTSAAKSSISKGTPADSALVDLGRAITALALSVQNIVDEAKRNPEVRRAALQTAGVAVSVAQKSARGEPGRDREAARGSEPQDRDARRGAEGEAGGPEEGEADHALTGGSTSGRTFQRRSADL